jgi:uncharacterized protein YgiB involved in biofilm formation
MKRSSKTGSTLIHLAALGTVALLSGCESDSEAVIYPGIEQCVAADVISDQACRAEYDRALANHANTAPQFDSQSACEAEFGRCQTTQTSSGSFVPFMMGYMIASAVGGAPFNNAGGYRSQPLYQTRFEGNNQWRTAGDQRVSGSGRVMVNASAAAPQTRAITASRSGFGSTASARGGWGS